jgi:hypothetical protein
MMLHCCFFCLYATGASVSVSISNSASTGAELVAPAPASTVNGISSFQCFTCLNDAALLLVLHATGASVNVSIIMVHQKLASNIECLHDAALLLLLHATGASVSVSISNSASTGAELVASAAGNNIYDVTVRTAYVGCVGPVTTLNVGTLTLMVTGQPLASLTPASASIRLSGSATFVASQSINPNAGAGAGIM